jgi:hypothetical protein
MRAIVAAAVLLVLAGCDATSDGRKAYDDGHYADAQAAFASASRGDSASAELLYDQALAALRAGDLAAADAALARMSGLVPLRDFLRGNVAFARCELAARQAQTAEAEPFAFEVAIAHAKTARGAWQDAAMSRPDWPEARRNVERAGLAIAKLQRLQEDAGRRSAKAGRPEVRLRPAPRAKPADDRPPTSQTTADTPGKEPSAAANEAELTPEQVRELFDRLAAKEKERIAARRSRRQDKSADVESDW